MMYGEIDFVTTIAFPVEEKADFRAKISRFLRERTAVRQFAERSNRDDNPIEPTLSALKASAFPDVGCDCVEVCQRLGCNLNAKSHASSEVAFPHGSVEWLRRVRTARCHA